MRILNLGCGDDISGTDRIDFVKTKATTAEADLNYGIPYISDTFDLIICKSVLEHIKNLDIFIKEIYRILKPGGKLILRTDNAAYLAFYLFKKNEHNNYIKYSWNSEDAHYHLFVESHLTKLFKDFKDIKFSYYHTKKIYKILGKLGALHLDMQATKGIQNTSPKTPGTSQGGI